MELLLLRNAAAAAADAEAYFAKTCRHSCSTCRIRHGHSPLLLIVVVHVVVVVGAVAGAAGAAGAAAVLVGAAPLAALVGSAALVGAADAALVGVDAVSSSSSP